MPIIRLSGKSYELFKFENLTLDEFVPVVTFNRSAYKDAKKAHVTKTKKMLELSDKIDADKRSIPQFSFIAAPGKVKIPFKVDCGISSLDNDGLITAEVKPASGAVSVNPGSSFKAKISEPFEIELNITGNEDKHFTIVLYADDDTDDLNQGEFKNIHCGEIECFVFSDVFTEIESRRLVDEILYIKPFADAGSPTEYGGNYCMAAAERGISRLLDNTTDFYSVDRSHNRQNRISFAGKGAKDRGRRFDTLGYAKSSFTFDDYQVNHNLRVKVKNNVDFRANAYKVVTLNQGSALYKYIENSIKNRRGFHVYYFSVSDDFHTLLLVVDNRNPANETYTMYDQHGKTSSFGKVIHIEDGFARQTSWTFLNFYANKGYQPDLYGGVTTRIWKIQRKI